MHHLLQLLPIILLPHLVHVCSSVSTWSHECPDDSPCLHRQQVGGHEGRTDTRSSHERTAGTSPTQLHSSETIHTSPLLHRHCLPNLVASARLPLDERAASVLPVTTQASPGQQGPSGRPVVSAISHAVSSVSAAIWPVVSAMSHSVSSVSAVLHAASGVSAVRRRRHRRHRRHRRRRERRHRLIANRTPWSIATPAPVTAVTDAANPDSHVTDGTARVTDHVTGEASCDGSVTGRGAGIRAMGWSVLRLRCSKLTKSASRQRVSPGRERSRCREEFNAEHPSHVNVLIVLTDGRGGKQETAQIDRKTNKS